LGEVADNLIGHFVEQVRGSGSSWIDIGKSISVTKQAPHATPRCAIIPT
jgi:hypothetical protein